MTTKEQLTEKVERGISLFRQHRTAINHFVELVKCRAEDKVIMAGKLAGAHYVAMKESQKAINR